MSQLRQIASAETSQEMATQLRTLRKILSGKTVCSAKQHLLDPVFNLHEIKKNALLFEDHLSTPNKYCPECLNKHALLMEAFADEALALDTHGRWRKVLIQTLPQILMLREALNDPRMSEDSRRLSLQNIIDRILAGLPPT